MRIKIRIRIKERLKTTGWRKRGGIRIKIKMKGGLKGKVTSDRIFFEKRRFNVGWKQRFKKGWRRWLGWSDGCGVSG